jgi:hypothetical protein
MWRLLFLLLSFNLISIAWGSCPLKDGDLVYIKSQSSQSALLKIVTASAWTHTGMAFKNKNQWEIIEAVQPVKWTSLQSFITRSRDAHFEIHRPIFSFDAEKVKEYAVAQLGKNYDLIFAWDNERWYCSELTYKAFDKGAQEQIGTPERVGDLNVNDISVLNEAKKRFQSYGMVFDAEVWKNSQVITPVQMMKSDKVRRVFDQNDSNELRDCLRSEKNF